MRVVTIFGAPPPFFCTFGAHNGIHSPGTLGVSRSQFVMKQDVIGGAASQGVRPLDTTGLANLARSILETDWAENQDKMFRCVELMS